MANRSDKGAALPRRYKRMISLMFKDADPHRVGEVRRMFINAHAIEQDARKKMLTQKSDGLDEQGTALPTETVSV